MDRFDDPWQAHFDSQMLSGAPLRVPNELRRRPEALEGEAAAIDRSLRLVLQDIDPTATGEFVGEARLEWFVARYPSDFESNHTGWTVFVERNGELAISFDVHSTLPQDLVLMADRLQDLVADLEHRAVPPCPVDGRMLMPAVIDGEARWICRESDHPRPLIGSLRSSGGS